MNSPTDHPTHTSTNNSDPANRRQRIKNACTPCKKRKRKCNGEQPCSTCVRYEYVCFFETVARKRRSRQPEGLVGGVGGGSPGVGNGSGDLNSEGGNSNERDRERERERGRDSGIVTTPREANSGAAFAQLLRNRLEPRQLDSDSEPPDRTSLSLNIGMSSEETQDLPSELTRLISKAQMQRLAESYFTTIHELYGFLNRDVFDAKVEERWGMIYVPGPYDSILCGVAALGSQYMGESTVNAGKELEIKLVECAKRMLEITSASNTPSYENAAAWTLRTIYLRSTTQPYAAWITSCTAMLTIDGLGPSSSSPNPEDISSGSRIVDPPRLLCSATILNTWLSNEYSRTRVELSSPLPTLLPRSGDYTPSLLYLYRISEVIDPKRPSTAADFISSISTLTSFSPPVDALYLSQSNLALALYRRLRFISSTIPDSTIRRVIELGNVGLDAVLRLVRKRQPWWHVANVPFQFVCTLLVVDTEEALGGLRRAVDTLNAVAECFPTRSLTETCVSVRKLIQLACKQKRGQLGLLEGSLAPRPRPVMGREVSILGTGGVDGGVVGEGGGEEVVQDWSPESMDFTDFDWERFFSMDVGVLEYPVPMG